MSVFMCTKCGQYFSEGDLIYDSEVCADCLGVVLSGSEDLQRDDLNDLETEVLDCLNDAEGVPRPAAERTIRLIWEVRRARDASSAKGLQSSAPDWIHASLNRWTENHIPPGDFLSAVLKNDLKEACARADDDSAKALHAIVSHCYQHLPANCWGSEEKFNAWRDSR